MEKDNHRNINVDRLEGTRIPNLVNAFPHGACMTPHKS